MDAYPLAMRLSCNLFVLRIEAVVLLKFNKLYHANVESFDVFTVSERWPNTETCSLKRIQDITLQRQASVPRDNVS